MKEIFSLLTALLLTTNPILSQTIDRLINGPLIGFTFAPAAKGFAIATDMVALSANSAYDKFGREIVSAFPMISQEQALTVYNISGGYSLNNNVGLLTYIPYISKQKSKVHSFVTNNDTTLLKNGDTGIGDMAFGAWYILNKTKTNRLMVLGYVTFATGSSPEDVNEDNLSPTGIGTSSYNFLAASDIMVTPNTLVSFSTCFTTNKKASFSSWDQKNGNEMYFSGRVSYRVSPGFSTGLVFDFSFKDKTRIDNALVDGSNSNFTSIKPVAGFQLSPGKIKINISGGYSLLLSGTNIPKFAGFNAGVLMFF